MNKIENNIERESPKTPVPGDILSGGMGLYILTYFMQPDGHENNVVYMAVNLIDGNRWYNPTGSIKAATKGLTLVGNVKLTVDRI